MMHKSPKQADIRLPQLMRETDDNESRAIISAIGSQYIAVMPERSEFHARQSRCSKELRDSYIRGELKSNSVTENTHLFSKIEICASLQAIIQSPELFPHLAGLSGSFMDLGCSNGRVLLTVANAGWRSYGVDLSDSCIAEAQENITRAHARGFVNQDLIHIAHGNFFPFDFKVDRLPNISEHHWLNYLKELAVSAPQWETLAPQLGITYQEIDFFYHYQVERMSNILNLFAEHAKPGAILAVVATFKEEQTALPENLVDLGRCGPAGYLDPIQLLQKIR